MCVPCLENTGVCILPTYCSTYLVTGEFLQANSPLVQVWIELHVRTKGLQ